MKKIMFTIAAISAVLVGCSKSEVITAPGADSPIEFNPYTGRTPVTKATEATTSTLEVDGFQVYAYIHPANGTNYSGEPYMSKKVTKPENATEWQYDGTSYWPITNQLDFIAYGLNAQNEDKTNIVEDLSAMTDNVPTPTITYNVPGVVAEQKDLLVAVPQKNQAHGGENKNVELNFNHMLSRIAFSLVTKDGNSIPVTIEKLQLKGNFFTTGDVNLTSEAPAITQETQGTDVVYDLLPNGSFTSLANAAGVSVFDNSMFYELTGINAENSEDFSTAAYSETFPFRYVSAKEAAAAEDVYVYKYGDEYVYKSDDKYYELTLADGVYIAPETPEEVTGVVAESLTLYKDTDEYKTYASNEENRYMMIIPTADANGTSLAPATVDITYFLPGAGSYDISVPLNVDGTPIAFKRGTAYNFKFKVSTNGISFSVGIDTWADKSVNPQEFPLS